jgi:putative transcriptional regulator
MTQKKKGSRVGDDLVAGFREMAAFLRGEIDAESYELPDTVLTPDRIKEIRRKVASSTREFERQFRVSARTMEAYEQGRRRPDDAMVALLKIIERAPEAARAPIKSKAYFSVYRDKQRQWRWTLRAANGRKIADSGEGYSSKSDCLAGIELVKHSTLAPVKAKAA